MFARTALLGLSALASVALAAPACAVALIQSYTVQTNYNLRHGISYNTYGDGSTGLTSSYDIPAPGGTVRDPFDKDSENPPLLTYLMATSDLSTVVAASPAAVLAEHLVIGFNTAFATTLLARGDDFATTFEGFDEISLISALQTLDSAPEGDERDQAGSLLFSFSDRVNQLGGLTNAAGGGLTFLSFSRPALAGTGSANLTPVPSTPAVPEPATWTMMLCGFALAGASLRQRRAAIA